MQPSRIAKRDETLLLQFAAKDFKHNCVFDYSFKLITSRTAAKYDNIVHGG